LQVVRCAPWQLDFFAGAYIDDLGAEYHATLWKLGLVGSAILLVTALTAGLVSRDITRSLGSLRGAMARLATGDLATSVPETARRDEVGEMAAAMLVFKDHMVRSEQLTAEREAERSRATAEKQAALAGMADTIEAETAVALGQISTRVQTMNDMAADMQSSAARTGASASSAAASADETLLTTQTVASATEQLSASIREISQQVTQSTSVVGRAVTASDATRAAMETLTGKVERIGAVSSDGCHKAGGRDQRQPDARHCCSATALHSR
jgi:methyl-accepting chemotaxis protein